jgi:hypothetical protein
MSLDSIITVAGLAGQQGQDQEQGQDAEAAAKKAQDSAADKLERLGKLQVVFNIKEAKRSSLEQKAMREMFMNMTKGEGGGGLGDLKGMFDALQGGGGDGKMPDMDALNAMLGGAGGGAGGGMPGGIPDLGNMDPAEVQAMSNDAISALKQALQDGSVTKKDVEELEKMMGVDVKQLVKMMDSGQVDKEKLKELGSDFGELVDLFRALSKIK